VLSWDTGAGKLGRKACCLELLSKLFEDNKHLSTSLIKSNPRILVACVGGLQFAQRDPDLEGDSYADEVCCSRIGVAVRSLLKNIMYEDEMDEEVIKALWRVRRYIPLEDGLWKSPALKNLGSTIHDMPEDDELKELLDIRNMKQAGAWKKAMTERSFWIGMFFRVTSPVLPILLAARGVVHFDDYCARDLAGWMIGDGVLLFLICLIMVAFELSVRVMEWAKR